MLAVVGCFVPEKDLFFYVADVLCFTGFGGRGKIRFFFMLRRTSGKNWVFFMLGPPGPLRAPSTAPNIKKTSSSQGEIRGTIFL